MCLLDVYGQVLSEALSQGLGSFKGHSIHLTILPYMNLDGFYNNVFKITSTKGLELAKGSVR